MSHLRLATLFSGIGAPEQGALRVYNSVETVFACEWDKFARRSYEAIYSPDGSTFFVDVRDLVAKAFRGRVDILVGGSPCQDFSLAGKRAGFEGFRGTLTGEFVRVVSEVMPPIFIFENVPGILDAKHKHGLKLFLEKLRGLGYHLHIELPNTKDYGVPQSRKRYYVIGFLGHTVYERFTFAPTIPLEKCILDILEPHVPLNYYLSQKQLDGYGLHAEKQKEQGNGWTFEPKAKTDIANAITTREGQRGYNTFVVDSPICLFNTNPSDKGINGNVFDSTKASPTVTTNKGEGLKVAIPMFMDDYNQIIKEDGVSPVLTSNCGQGAIHNGIKVLEPIIAASRGRNIDNPSDRTAGAKVSQRLEPREDGCSNTITTVAKDNYVLIPIVKKWKSIGRIKLRGAWWYVRKLTPRECWRLQDFPDWAFDRAREVNSNAQLYKQAGNSMSVNILEMIYRQIERALAGESPDGTLF